MTSHKKAPSFSRQAFFPGAHFCNEISAVSYDLTYAKIFWEKYNITINNYHGKLRILYSVERYLNNGLAKYSGLA